MCEESDDAYELLAPVLYGLAEAPWMNGFTERPATADDAAWSVALYAAPHARPFMQQPTEDAVRAALGRADLVERIVLDAAGERIAIWRAKLEEPWLAEIHTLAVARPGAGAGSWALRRALAWAFEEQSVHKAFLYVTAANARARALYERHGLQWEGTHRDGFRGPDGSFEDLTHYGILDREYAAWRTTAP
jgi:RimJ/RimL family protein N-acetyltransferase